MLDALLQPATVTRLLHLLQAAQPFLTPSWSRLADMCIRLLNISELLFNPRKTDISRLLSDIRGCTPSNDMNALLCAIRPFCSDGELQMLQMYEQFQQMQKAMDMWKMFSDLMPDADGSPGTTSPFDTLAGLFGSGADTSTPKSSYETEATTNPLLAFLSPEQLSLYNSILADTDEHPFASAPTDL